MSTLDSPRFIIGPEDPAKAVGFIRLVDMMPRASCFGGSTNVDGSIVQAARVSYGEGTKKVNEDRGLIRYLLRHKHTTPFEMVQFKFHLRMPIFIYRQWFRHRSSEQGELEISSTDEAARKYLSMNEYSARYSVVPDLYYVPKEFRGQSKTNKQGGDLPLEGDAAALAQNDYTNFMPAAYDCYQQMLGFGVSRELARLVLPVSYVTEFYMSINLWNLLHMLTLRCDSHAQLEIRHYANALAWYVRQYVPITYQAWLDYMVNGAPFSATELLLLQRMVHEHCDPEELLTGRELDEFKAKLVRRPIDPAGLAETQPIL